VLRYLHLHHQDPPSINKNTATSSELVAAGDVFSINPQITPQLAYDLHLRTKRQNVLDNVKGVVFRRNPALLSRKKQSYYKEHIEWSIIHRYQLLEKNRNYSI
jgi:hypothetical protein